MGKVGRIVGGVLIAIGGIAIGVFTGNWTLALAVTNVGVGMLLHKSVPQTLNERQGAILQNRVGALERLPVVYGTARLGGAFVDIRVDANSEDRKRLVIATAFCHGSRNGQGVSQIQQIWFDDRLAVDGTTVKPPFNGSPEGSSRVFLRYAGHTGNTTDPVDTILTAAFPSQWPSTSRGKGVCYGVFDMWYDQNVYPGSVPTIQAVIKGNLVYDPRAGFWAHSSNPALCIRDYLLSPIYGWGVPEESLDDASFIAMANYCDELVSVPGGGTQKRYEINGWVDTMRSVEQNLVELCTACRAQVVNEGDKWRMFIRRQRSVSGFQITEENTVEGSWQFLLPGMEAVANVGRATYVDPNRDYDVDSVQWPDPGIVNTLIAEDNDFEQRLELDLPYTQDRFMAQQLIMTLVKESRFAVGAIFTLNDDALNCRVGDLVEVTHSTPGWVKKIMDVNAILIQPNGQVRIVLVEYSADAYDLDTQIPHTPPPDTVLPDPLSIAPPTNLVLTSTGQELQTNDGRYVARIRATWTKVSDPFLSYYEVQAKKTVETQWDSFGRVSRGQDALYYVYPVTDEQWSVRIRAVNQLGIESDWISQDVLVVTPSPRPQILSITLTNTHADKAHIDTHTDLAHADAAHADTHTDHADHADVAHTDTHADSAHVDNHQDFHDDLGSPDPHQDTHGDYNGTHTDTHNDTHSDNVTAHTDWHVDEGVSPDPHSDDHGDVGGHGDSHSDTHTDHTDHSDVAHGDSHSDALHTDTGVGHTDVHSDTSHADSAHGDGHVDNLHSDGQYGVGVAIQSDTDSASVRAIARKHGDHADGTHTDVTDPTIAEVRTQAAADGRNVVIELIDVATGDQISMDPGDRVRVGAVAYSKAGAAGVEGPLALASVGLFTVAPVGADKWVPA